MQVRLAQIIRAQAGRAVAAVAWESSMSRLVFTAIALTGAGFAVSAQAADIPYYGARPPAYAPYTVPQQLDCYSWAGPYLGGNLVYA